LKRRTGMGDSMSEISDLISIVTNIIRGTSIFNVLLLVGISVFLVAYFDTSSLRAALGFRCFRLNGIADLYCWENS